MYVIATVICPNFHFSVSPHVPFLNLLFEQIAYSNAYFLAKFGFDTAESEPCQVSSPEIIFGRQGICARDSCAVQKRPGAGGSDREQVAREPEL